ncbi:MAG: aminoglycoside N(3)-acetyltransferase [Streptosporangiaceae bacterium]
MTGENPFGRKRLAEDLRALGIRRGQDLLVHCSLRQVGFLEGGAATLLDSIVDVAGPMATLVVPTQTTLNSLSSRAFLAATAGFEAEERAEFIAAMPGFDPASTPSTGMGAFAEYVRTHPSAIRSSHPQASFAALGPRARACTSVHDLECHLGDRSPLGWLYRADAAILLLGVGYSACVAFHLAEYHQLKPPPLRLYHCFIAGAQGRVVREFLDIELDDSDFELLGAELDRIAEPDRSSVLRQGRVGSAGCRLMQLRPAVDFGSRWLADHRR